MIQIPFGSLPGIPELFRDYVGGSLKKPELYSHRPDIASVIEMARRRLNEPLPHREVLCRCLAEQQKNWGGRTDSVDGSLARGAVAVVTGQQPGLFTGPMYAILKAITIIKLTRRLEAAGIPAVPVFWIAAEDHDFEEIRWASVLDRESNVRRFRVDLHNEDASPVGWLKFKDDVSAEANACLENLPQSEFQAGVREILEASYRPGTSPVDSFARMMTKLFGDSGMILVDPLHPAVKEIAAPMLREVIQRNAEIRLAVAARSRLVSEVGYHEQVKVDGDFTGLFALRGRSRKALKPADLGVDQVLSPNVLVRPAIQDKIFPTAAFVAGPAEIAYLAQAGPVYAALGREQAPIVPRISATVLETRVARPLRKYGLSPVDSFQGREFLKRRAVENSQGTADFARVKNRIDEEVESLRGPIKAVDQTLAGALETAKQKMRHQIETLETKFINAEARRHDVMEKQLDLIGHALFPEKKLQERVINVTSFLVRYGPQFLIHLERELDLDVAAHQVVEI